MTLARLSSTIGRLSGGQALTVSRRGAGTLDHGRFTPATPTTFDIAASVQPVSGRDLLRLPEGLRTRELVAVFTGGDLRTADEAAGLAADRFVYGGRTYEVQTLEDWTQLGGYRKAIAAKVDA